jgi:hypothetical protein
MGILNLIRPNGTRGDAAAALHVLPRNGPFPGNRGDTLYSHGYVPLDGHGSVLGEADFRTADSRIFHCRVVGTHHRPSALRDRRFDPGSKVLLRADPTNTYDGSIISVWDSAGSVQLGHVPAALSRSLAPLMRAGTTFGGEVLRELRLGSERGERVAVHILVAPTGALRYAVAKPER